ncbi:hypothetical protein [uncultured Chitinophaga sp.]|uniref:DUF6934 family protein n=1 Tax=uncultured Chitinophaga sp. TaxID=339340 RepID=UPI0025F35C32|nr:hypothetical protein [uncultured Chitinophaga sp.]
MNLDRYEFQAGYNYHVFTFKSTGPNGVVPKVITYQPTQIKTPDGRQIVNIAFGDWNNDKNDLDDYSRSNNSDRDKVLATVASTIILYCVKHGSPVIMAMGSTPARTRLYQMGLNMHWAEIKSMFWVKGWANGRWTDFRPGVNFEAFLVIRKIG